MELFVEFYEKAYSRDPVNVLSAIQLLQFVISEATVSHFSFLSLHKAG